MTEFDPDVLSVIGEAVVIARSGKIIFANTPAVSLSGGEIVGKRLSSVFGQDISGTQAADFSANISLNGKDCIVRSSRKKSEQILVINETKVNVPVINEAFLYSLRSSLMVMSMSSERCRTLAREMGNAEMLGTADSLTKNLSSIARLVANTSTVCAVQSGTIRFAPRKHDISRLFAQFTDIAAGLLPQVKIAFEAPDGLQAAVDADLMKQLLTNLISNAVLHGKCRKLRIRLIDSAENVIIAVSDDGDGIKSEELYNVFERYLDTMELSEISRGVGLGLTVVMGIARLHGGTVLLESRPEHGTAVSVSLRKNLNGAAMCSDLLSPEDAADILTGLSDCVDEKRFREAFFE